MEIFSYTRSFEKIWSVKIFYVLPKLGARSPPMLILTLRPHGAIIIKEDKQQRAMSEVDLKSKVGCFLPKSPQVVLSTSRRLEVDLGSLLYQVGSDWHTKVAPRSTRRESQTKGLVVARLLCGLWSKPSVSGSSCFGKQVL